MHSKDGARRGLRLFLKALIPFSLVLLLFAYWFLNPPSPKLAYPDNKEFAFAIFDDTDTANIEDVKAIYDLLFNLGIPATKSVWVLPSRELDNTANQGQSLTDPEYLEFILNLKSQGFEIGYHGARGGSTTRDESILALDTFKELIGENPYVYVNHSRNKEDIYWGPTRLTLPFLQRVYSLKMDEKPDYFEGHVESSEYFWGDLVKERIKYVRNFTFKNINTLKYDPVMPYHDPRKPFVNLWFSSSDAPTAAKFKHIVNKETIDRLEKEGGVCIIYTHFAHNFVLENGSVDPEIEEILRYLASRPGYFATTGQLLDFLQSSQEHKLNTLSFRQRMSLELKWVVDKTFRTHPAPQN
jgi:hypothetical protein